MISRVKSLTFKPKVRLKLYPEFSCFMVDCVRHKFKWNVVKIWSWCCNILFESAKKYLQEHLGESKTLNISKWKAEIGTLRKEKDSLYSQIKDIRKEMEQAESVRSCIDKLLQEKRDLTQVKKHELVL